MYFICEVYVSYNNVIICRVISIMHCKVGQCLYLPINFLSHRVMLVLMSEPVAIVFVRITFILENNY